MNRAERRRRGLTRSRMARTGSLASAGVLLSVGLFGAYTGNPRIQRAYASPGCTSQNAYPVTVDDSLIAALNDPNVTCIEIRNSFQLYAPLPEVNDLIWDAGPRESDGLTIFGSGDDTIDGNTQRGLNISLTDIGTPVDLPVKLTISNVTLENFDGPHGAAVGLFMHDQPAPSQVVIDNVDFLGNHSSESGAALYVRSYYSDTTVTITDSYFANNVSKWGGAVYLYGKNTLTTSITSSTFRHNRASVAADVDGGAIFASSDVHTYLYLNHDTHFIDNSAASRGGAVFAGWHPGSTSTVTVAQGVSFIDNEAGTNTNTYVPTGGAIHTNGSVTIADSTSDPVVFDGNQAAASGGAIYAAGQVTVGAGASFERNTATATQPDPNNLPNLIPAHGGAIFTASSVTVTGTSDHPVAFAYDSATQYGGAIYSKDGADIASAIFQHNTAKGGGAVYNWDGGMTIAESTIANNTATSAGGGGVYSGGGTARLYNSAIVDNTAYVWSGGGISVVGGPLVLENSFIGGNYATDRAGGIFMQSAGGDVDLRFSTVYDDTTATGIATEIYSRNITSVMSVVGNSSTDDIWEFTGTLDDSYSVSTSDGPAFTGNGSYNFAPGDLEFEAADGAAPGQWGRTPSATSPLTAPEPNGPAPLFNPLPGIMTDQLGVTRVAPFTIGARQGVPPSPTNPPAPTPSVPASAPREVRVEAALESAKVSWLPPASTGSFPVTSYQAVASPGGQTCMVAAPALTCTITGLTPGKPYTVTARALTGAGWSEPSSPSSVIVPLGPEVPTILITNSRDRAQKSMARIEGTTTGLIGAEVVPYLRIAGQTDFTPGASTRTVDAEGNFVWQRKAKKRFTVYFVSGDVTSNRLLIRPE